MLKNSLLIAAAVGVLGIIIFVFPTPQIATVLDSLGVDADPETNDLHRTYDMYEKPFGSG